MCTNNETPIRPRTDPTLTGTAWKLSPMRSMWFRWPGNWELGSGPNCKHWQTHIGLQCITTVFLRGYLRRTHASCLLFCYSQTCRIQLQYLSHAAISATQTWYCFIACPACPWLLDTFGCVVVGLCCRGRRWPTSHPHAWYVHGPALEDLFWEVDS